METAFLNVTASQPRRKNIDIFTAVRTRVSHIVGRFVSKPPAFLVCRCCLVFFVTWMSLNNGIPFMWNSSLFGLYKPKKKFRGYFFLQTLVTAITFRKSKNHALKRYITPDKIVL
jgi:hypothetical protein